jgi:hypothetical protein
LRLHAVDVEVQVVQGPASRGVDGEAAEPVAQRHGHACRDDGQRRADEQQGHGVPAVCAQDDRLGARLDVLEADGW